MGLHYKGCITLLLTAALLLFVYTYLSSGGNIPKGLTNVPEVDPILQGVNHMALVPATLATEPAHPYQPGFHLYMQPHYDCAQNVVMPHRYPAVSGGNISLIIHKGWDEMMRPAPQDNDWMVSPPSEMNGYEL